MAKFHETPRTKIAIRHRRLLRYAMTKGKMPSNTQAYASLSQRQRIDIQHPQASSTNRVLLADNRRYETSSSVYARISKIIDKFYHLWSIDLLS